MLRCLSANTKREILSVCSWFGYSKIDLIRRQKDTKIYFGFGRSVIKIIDY